MTNDTDERIKRVEITRLDQIRLDSGRGVQARIYKEGAQVVKIRFEFYGEDMAITDVVDVRDREQIDALIHVAAECLTEWARAPGGNYD